MTVNEPPRPTLVHQLRRTYGPWNAPGVAPQLREPFSYMRTRSGFFVQRPGDVLGVVCYSSFSVWFAWQLAVLAAAGETAGAIVMGVLAAIMALVTIIPVSRLLWRARVKTLTGMTPRQVEQSGIDPTTLSVDGAVGGGCR